MFIYQDEKFVYCQSNYTSLLHQACSLKLRYISLSWFLMFSMSFVLSSSVRYFSHLFKMHHFSSFFFLLSFSLIVSIALCRFFVFCLIARSLISERMSTLSTVQLDHSTALLSLRRMFCQTAAVEIESNDASMFVDALVLLKHHLLIVNI